MKTHAPRSSHATSARIGDDVRLPAPLPACRLVGAVRVSPSGSLWPLQDRTRQRWALKQAHTHESDREVQARWQWQRQAKGPCTLPVIMAWRAGEVVYALEPWALGPTLAEQMDAELAAGITLGVGALLHRFAQLVRAVCDAHAAGVLHRDLKPDNAMFLSRTCSPKSLRLTDFHLACPLSASTCEGAGTTAYLAPEVARGEAASTASDVFSLGATLTEMVVGMTPYEGDTEDQTAQALVEGQARLRSTDIELFLRHRGAERAHAGALSSWIAMLCDEDRDKRPRADRILRDVQLWRAELS